MAVLLCSVHGPWHRKVSDFHRFTMYRRGRGDQLEYSNSMAGKASRGYFGKEGEFLFLFSINHMYFN